MTSLLEDSNESMVTPGPLQWAPPLPAPARRPPNWSALWKAAWISTVVVTVVGIIGSLVTLPYYSISPGLARPINSLVSVDGAESFPPDGRILLTTVSLRHANVWEALWGWISPDVAVYGEDVLFPPSVEDRTAFNLAMMDTSKQTAIVVALRHLGYDVAERGDGALVLAVEPGYPAEGKLDVGDAVTAIDDTPVTTATEAVAVLGSKAPGDDVVLAVRSPGGEFRTVELALADRGDGRPVVGVQLQTANIAFDLPFTVDIDSGAVGGPSAGLAFALAVIDRLSEGELTGGLRVAVTGTIDLNGTVGPVGGVAQKTEAVKAAGADVFLVPPEEYDEAAARAGQDLRVERVTSLDDALAVLARFGGNGLALSRPAA